MIKETLLQGITRLASLWLTIALLSAIVGLLVTSRFAEIQIGNLIAIPFAGLFLNLLAAIATKSRIRASAGLLVFHLSLATIAILASLGNLSAMRGHVEVTEGMAFNANSAVTTAGPLHSNGLDKVQFIQGKYEIDYAPGMRRRDTRSIVFVPDKNQKWRQAVVGDDAPLVVAGYRFYTSFNKGFAPVLAFTDKNGIRQMGSVHMPSYPINYDNQMNEWIPSDGSPPIIFRLKLGVPVYAENDQWSFKVPDDPILVIRDREMRVELQLGESVRLEHGTLEFADIRTWMGYAIFYDPSVFWMLAAVGVGVAGLVWHVFNRFRNSPWDSSSSWDNAAHAD